MLLVAKRVFEEYEQEELEAELFCALAGGSDVVIVVVLSVF